LKNHKKFATVEILPQYLTLSAPECYEKLGSLWQQNPPIRSSRHMEFLWKAVHDGTVDVIGSDHAPHTLDEKAKPYPNSPSGVPGVQTLVPLMLDQVSKEKLSFEKQRTY
jgi:dihydroorotase